jgi:zinc transporter 5/7
VETLSGLFNGIFLVFIAFNVFCESIERIFEPQKIETDGLLTVSVLGLGVNLVGLFFFHEHHDHGGHDHNHGDNNHHHHHHDNENMYGVFLHVLADCLGSVGVIVSSLLVRYRGLYVADPICSFVISLMILASSVPFIKLTASTLMLRNSKALARRAGKIRAKVDLMPGVVELRRMQMWEMTPKKAAVGALEVVVTESAVRGVLHDEISTLLRSNKVKDVTV